MAAGQASAVFEAIAAGKTGALVALLDADPTLVTATTDRLDRAQSADEAGMTPLHAAIAAKQGPAVRILIERGAEVSARNGGGRMALHDAFEYGQDVLAQMLIAAGSEVDACAAAAFGRLNDLKSRLVANPLEANDLTTGLTPIGWAAYGQQVEAAKMLISAGAKVVGDPYDELVWGPTCDVAAIGVAKVILAAGADPNWQDPDGNTPMHLAIVSPIVVEPAHFILALLEGGADRSIRNAAGRTALEETMARLAIPGRKSLHATVQVFSAR